MPDADAAVPAVTEQAVSTPAPAQDQAPASDQADLLGTPASFSLDDVPEDYRSRVQSKLDEVEALRKSLHGDYTRKTQEIADARQKAEIADFILNHPDAEKILSLLDGGQAAQPAAGPADIATLLQTDPAAAVQAIKEQVRAEMEAEIAPVKESYRQQTEAEAANRAQAVYDGLLEKYPDLPEYEADVAAKVSKGYDPEDAIKAVRHDRVYQKGIDQGAKAAAARDAAKLPESRPAAAVAPGRPKSFKEAWEQAKKETGWSG